MKCEATSRNQNKTS